MENTVSRCKADIAQAIGHVQTLLQVLQREVTALPDGAEVHGKVAPTNAEAPAAAAPEATRIFQGCVVNVPGLGHFYIPDVMRNDFILQILGRGHEWEPETTDVYRALVKPGDFVMDVGAFNGSRSIRLSQLVGPDGCVYAFEPQTDIRAQLNINLALNNIDNVVVLPYAAANRYGSDKFYLDPTNRGASSVCAHEVRTELRTIHYVPIDDVVPDRPVTFMKIDVEGSELNMLIGARQTLTKYHPALFIEVFPEEKRRYNNVKTTRAEVFGLLYELGYDPPAVDNPHDNHVILPRRRR